MWLFAGGERESLCQTGEGGACTAEMSSPHSLCQATGGNRGTVPRRPDSAYASPVVLVKPCGLETDDAQRVGGGETPGGERGPSPTRVASSQNLCVCKELVWGQRGDRGGEAGTGTGLVFNKTVLSYDVGQQRSELFQRRVNTLYLSAPYSDRRAIL